MFDKDELTSEVKSDGNQAAAEQPIDVSKPEVNGKKRLWYGIAALVLLGLATFAIAFPLARRDDDDTTTSDSINGVQPNTGAASPTDTVGASPTDTGGASPSETGGTSPTDTEDDPNVATAMYVSNSTSPFQVRLAMFNKDIIRGYSQESELEDDLQNVAKFLLNKIIADNKLGDQYQYGVMPGSSAEGGAAPTMEDSAAAAAPAQSSSDAAMGKGVTDYGTNNQEEGVEEGDVIVSDGEHVFAGYGDTIVVWNPTTGELLTRVVMPAIEGQASAKEVVSSEAKMAADSMPSMYVSRPYINRMLLQGDRLLVVVDGYGPSFRNITGRDYPILTDYLGTHVRLYKIVSQEKGVLELVSTAQINGMFNHVRAINGKAHIITTSGIDTYTDLIAPFQYYLYNVTSEDQYVKQATKVAEEEAIPKFVGELMTELRAGGGMPNLFRISLFQSETSGTQVEDIAFADGAVNSVAQVHSFDMTSDATEITFVKSGAFLPTYWAEVYGNDDVLMLFGQGWEYDAKTRMSSTTTHILGVAISGASSKPFSIGQVSGYILNSRAVDELDGVLRLATTVQNNTFMFIDTMPVDAAAETKEGSESSAADTSVSSPSGSSVDGVAAVAPTTDNTQNFVITLNLTASDGIMKELGRIELGKPNEVFTAVRFFDDVAYAVTFERRDPLYVLDMSVPTQLKKLAELDISGFSSYLHPISDDNRLILGIGEEADDTGSSLGLQISVFDMTDLSNPKLAQRYVLKSENNSYSYSDAQWDFMSIRYVDGRLIIPVDTYSYDNSGSNFHGIVVYLANANVIQEECRVSQTVEMTNANANQWCCGGGYLPRRSMIFDGNLVTTDASMVRSTDMETCTLLWDLDVTDPNLQNCTCNGYGILY